MIREPDETYETQAVFLPCVYAWRRGEHWLYVGLGRNGLGRPFTASHQTLNRVERFTLEDRIEVWRFRDYREAEEFEKALIRARKPKHNQAECVRYTCLDCGRSWGGRKITPRKCKYCQSHTWNGPSTYPQRTEQS